MLPEVRVSVVGRPRLCRDCPYPGRFRVVGAITRYVCHDHLRVVAAGHRVVWAGPRPQTDAAGVDLPVVHRPSRGVQHSATVSLNPAAGRKQAPIQ